jgi:hypothetical protein
MNEMRDRLVEILLQKTCHYSDTPCDKECGVCGNIELYRSDVESLADHLIENGVVVPPCSLHQTLWEITWNRRIEQCKVSSLTQKADGSFKIRVSPKCSGVYEITSDKIGEKVFLTKSEAEQKLKEMRGNNEKNTDII